jgi:trans-2,3-dihydro-3-hydroxyanthranilate isomerase
VVFCLFAIDSPSEAVRICARALAPLIGIDEDPVTGSMQGGLAQYLLMNELIAPDTAVVQIEQGYAVRRPGSLVVDIAPDGEQRATVAGRAVHVFSAEVEL